MTNSVLRPLRGAQVVVRTGSALWRGTLLSCVKDSAWFVVDDTDVVVTSTTSCRCAPPEGRTCHRGARGP